MAKIGLDLRFYRSETGGVGRYSRNLLNELLKIDQTNEYTAIITPKDEPEFQATAPNLKKIVVDVVHYTSGEQTKLLSVLNQQQFDLVHFTMFSHPILYQRPFVVTIHDLIMHLYPTGGQKNSLLRRKAYELTINDCKRAKKIIVPSQSTKNDLVKMLHYPQERIAVTLEGSEEKFKVASAEAIKKVKEKYQLPDQYLLFVSRWEAYKGLPALIEAYKKLISSFPNLALVVTGKPDKQNPEISENIRKAQQAGLKIITPGFVDDNDLPIIYSGANVYVHPSWYEGFGIMILEAFASGVPVVTSNVSSLPEVAGEAALLINPRDPQEIADKISSILKDPKLAQELRTKGLERVEQFSWAKMAKETLTIYHEILTK